MKKYIESIGDTETTKFNIEHNLGTRDVIINTYNHLTGDTVYPTTLRDNENTVSIWFEEPPKSGMIRVVIIG